MPVEDLEESVTQRFSSARLWAVHRAPYLSGALFALKAVIVEPRIDDDTGELVPDPRFAAFPADPQWSVYLDPATVLATAVPHAGWWLLHHVGHLIRSHAARSPVHGATAAGADGVRSPETIHWNQAADAEINDDLDVAEWNGPEGVVSPRSLGLPDNRMAEEYLSMLEVLDSAVAPDDPALGRGIDCGSACDGVPRSWDDEPAPADGADDLDRELLARATAAEIARRAAERSDVPAGWRRWAQAQTTSTIDWRRHLRSVTCRSIATTAGNIDFSYRRPARRSAAFGDFVIPAMVRPVPEPLLLVDTSSSVGPAMLNAVLAEVVAILRAASRSTRSLRVICCDVQAYEVQRIRDVADLVLRGGGGTDLRAGLAAAEAVKPRPDLVVVVTDGQTEWPTRRPAVGSTIVCLVDNDVNVPDWATKVMTGW